MMLRTIVYCLIFLLAQASFAQKTTIKTVNVNEAEKILKMPFQFYYLEEDRDGDRVLHCYYPETKVDVTLEFELSTLADIVAIWPNKNLTKAFFIEEDGGTEIRTLTAYEIDEQNKITERLSLIGNKPCEFNNWSNEDDCHIRVVNDSILLVEGRDSNSEKGEKIKRFVTREFDSYVLPLPSKANIKDPEIGFVKITTDGVNIRKAPKTGSPRAGFWYCRECERSDMFNPTEWEDSKGTPPFTPRLADKNELFTYEKKDLCSSDWQPINLSINFQHAVGYVSKQFVQELQPNIISAENPLKNEQLQENILTIRDGKYAGLWIFHEQGGMDKEEVFHLGKLVNGKVIFYGTILSPTISRSVNGIEIFEGEVLAGISKTKEDHQGNIDFDITKLTESEFDILYSTAQPKGENIGIPKLILVDLPEREVIVSISD